MTPVFWYSSASGFFLSIIIILPPGHQSGLIRSASKEQIAHYVIKTESKSFHASRNISRFVLEDE